MNRFVASVVCGAVVGLATCAYSETINLSPSGTDDTAALNAAVAAANAGDEIQLADGTYKLTEQVLLKKKVTVRGNASDRTAVVIDCQRKCRAFEFSAAATLADLTVENGYLETSTSWGGGILLKSSGTVTNCVVRSCSIASNGYGGGIGGNYEASRSYVQGCEIYDCSANNGGGVHLNGNIRMTDSFVHDCTSTGDGGGVHCWPCTYATPHVAGELMDCIVSNCVSTGGNGGAFAAEYTINCRGNTFVDNRIDTAQKYGGAVYFTQDNETRTNTVAACTFIRNFAGAKTTGACGGAFSGKGNIAVTGCTFRANFAGWHGGAIFSEKDEPYFVRVTDCTFDGNRTNDDSGSRFGAAIRVNGRGTIEGSRFWNHDDFGCGVVFVDGAKNVTEPTIITDCIFSNNTCRCQGSAMQIQGACGAFVSNCTFVANSTPDQGAAVYLQSTNSVFHTCVFTNNVASKQGGAVFVAWFSNTDHEGGSRFENCRFLGNKSTTSYGGAAASDGAAGGRVNVFKDCVFNGNTAKTWGGAFYLGSRICLDGCSFTGNWVDRDNNSGAGGALSVYGMTNWVVNCAFTNNYANNIGGAIDLPVFNNLKPMQRYLIVSNCIFEANGTCLDATHAGWCGGAISDVRTPGGGLLVSHSRFAHNGTRYDGNAIRPYDKIPDGVVYTIRNCLFEENFAGDSGNTAVVVAFSNVTVEACTFVRNVRSANIPAVHIHEGARVINCVGWGNGQTNATGEVSTKNDFKFQTAGAKTAITNCCFAAVSAAAGVTGITAEALVSDCGCICTDDPQFADAAAGDWRPAAGSPLVNRAVWQDWMGVKVNDRRGMKDLAGKPRVSGSGPDIGAYELYFPSGLMLLLR